MAKKSGKTESKQETESIVVPAEVQKIFDKAMNNDHEEVVDNQEVKTESESEDSSVTRRFNKETDDPTEDRFRRELEGEDVGNEDEPGSEDHLREEEGNEPVENVDGEKEISQHLIDAGRSAGLSDEDIIEAATYQPRLLEALASSRNQQVADDGPATNQEAVQQSAQESSITDDLFNPVEIKIDEGEYDEDFVSGIVKPFQDKINQLTGAIKEVATAKNAVTQEQQAELVSQIDSHLDKIEKQGFSELGQSEKITPVQFEQRKSVVTMAQHIITGWNQSNPGKPMNLETALEKATNLIFNKQDSSGKLVSRINQTKKLFTTRPNGRNRRSMDESLTDEQAAANSVRAYARKRGINELQQ